jgi:hypothetical protein
MINWINELVDKDGVRLGGNNVKLSVDNSVSSSNSTIDPMYNPTNGRQLKNATALQRQQGYRKSPYSLVPMPTMTPGKDPSIDYMDDEEELSNPKKRLEDKSKQKMEEYVEDIVTKKFPKDVLNKVKSTDDIHRNGVPDVEVIAQENPVLVRKVKNLIDIIEKNQATGEQKGMILNYLINNIGMVDIPSEFKQEMLKKLR